MTKARDKYIEAFETEKRWLQKFIKDLENTPTAHGKKWKDAMLRHYRAKLKELLKERRKPL